MMRCLFVPIMLGLSVSAYCAAASPYPASPAPLAVIELIPHPGGTAMMTMAAEVRGQKGLFLFDTGGGVSYFTPAFAEKIHCKPWGQITGFTLTAQRIDMPRCDEMTFDVQGQHLVAPIAGVFDIMKYMPPKVPILDGSIGLDLFAGKALTLSLAQRKLIVESSASLAARVQHATEVPIRLVREAEGIALTAVVGVTTPQGKAWMELDTGNGGATVIGKHIAALLNLNPAIKEPQPASFNLLGGIPVEGMARVNETLTMDGNIGSRFLLNWDLTLDLAKGRAWLVRSRQE